MPRGQLAGSVLGHALPLRTTSSLHGPCATSVKKRRTATNGVSESSGRLTLRDRLRKRRVWANREKEKGGQETVGAEGSKTPQDNDGQATDEETEAQSSNYEHTERTDSCSCSEGDTHKNTHASMRPPHRRRWSQVRERRDVAPLETPHGWTQTRTKLGNGR